VRKYSYNYFYYISKNKLTKGDQKQLKEVVKKSMIKMMLADGKIDHEEIEMIQDIYYNLTQIRLSDEDVQNEINETEQDSFSLHDYLSEQASDLDDSGKEMVIKTIFFVAVADGKVTEDEEALLYSIADSLKMDVDHFNAIFDKLEKDLDEK